MRRMSWSRDVCISGDFGNAESSASGARVASIADGLLEHGYRVTSIGMASFVIAEDSQHDARSKAVRVEIQPTASSATGPVVMIRRDRTGISTAGPLILLMQNLAFVAAFLSAVDQWCREHRGGTLVLYGRRGEALLPCVLSARLRRCKVVLDVTEWFGRSAAPSFASWLSIVLAQRVVPRLVDHATLIVEEAASQLPRSLPVTHASAMAPRRVTQRAMRASPRETTSRAEHEFTCVFSGSEGGGLASVIAALGRLSRNHPHVRFILRTTRSGTVTLPPENSGRVEVVDEGALSQDDYLLLLESADCLIVPGTRGTDKDYAFPNRLPEYLLSGRPTIVSGYPAVGRMIRHREHALLLETDDVQELTRAIESVLLHPSQMDEMAKRGRSHALAVFSPARVMEPVAEVLRWGS